MHRSVPQSLSGPPVRVLALLFALLLAVLWAVPALAAGDCVIRMVYKDGPKPPFIKAPPDNSGAYLDLFGKAAEKIDCRLEVVRLPKKRVHKALAQGTVDFYPGASFSEKRASYLYYIPNGFETSEVGMTRADVPEITDLKQLKKLDDPLWIMELGSSKLAKAEKLGIRTHQLPLITIDIAVKLLTRKRADFYLADIEPVNFYLKESKYKSYEEMGIRLHPGCCGGSQPMYLGFSRFSKLYSEHANPNFDPTISLSPVNVPVEVDEDCVAGRLGRALRELQESGETEVIYNRYFFK